MLFFLRMRLRRDVTFCPGDMNNSHIPRTIESTLLRKRCVSTFSLLCIVILYLIKVNSQ